MHFVTDRQTDRIKVSTLTVGPKTDRKSWPQSDVWVVCSTGRLTDLRLWLIGQHVCLIVLKQVLADVLVWIVALASAPRAERCRYHTTSFCTHKTITLYPCKHAWVGWWRVGLVAVTRCVRSIKLLYLDGRLPADR